MKWTVEEREFIVDDVKGEDIALVFDEANTALVSSAPELLALLKEHLALQVSSSSQLDYGKLYRRTREVIQRIEKENGCE